MTRDNESRPTANEVRQAIDFTANDISQRYGLDVERVRAVLERTDYEGRNSPADLDYRDGDDRYVYLFDPSLAEALDYLQPEKALTLFEKEDLELLQKRATAFRYLFRRSAPFYSLDELEQLTKLFISYLKNNRDCVLKTGLSGQPFEKSPLLETLLSPLYFVKKPISSHIAESSEIGDTFYQYMWGSGNDGSAIRECSYEEAPVLEILTPEYAEYLNENRSKLFDLKIQILRKLLESLRTGDITNILDNCLRLLTETYDKYELESYINTDNAYIEAKIYLNENTTVWHRPVTGGITDLLEIIGHYEKELTIGTFAKTREALGQIISFDLLMYAPSNVSEIISPYFKYVALGVKEELDIALDLFSSLQAQEDDFWKEYRFRVGEDLKNIYLERIVFLECPAVRYRAETTQYNETHKTVVYTTTVAGEFADLLHQNLAYFAELFKLHIEYTGKPPEPPQLPSIGTPTVSENVFRKEGEIWRIAFADKSISLKDAKGLQYIAFLISHARKPFHVLDLIAEVEGSSSELDDKIYGRMSREQLNNDHHLSISRTGNTHEILDYEATKSLKNKLNYLKEELAKAEGNNDEGWMSKLREEIEVIEKQLVNAYRPSGQLSNFTDSGDKARKRVANAITRSLKKIEKENIHLWRHLNSFIDKGFRCSYDPPDDIEWSF